MTVTVEVDVDIDEIHTSDLVDAIIDRIDHYRESKRLTKHQIDELFDVLKLKRTKIDDKHRSMKTLEDVMKLNHIHAIWDKYSSSDIERLLPL